MALSSARIVQTTSFLGSLSHSEFQSRTTFPSKVGRPKWTCAYGPRNFPNEKPLARKLRDVRVGAKWLHGLGGESKTGGSGSSGSTLFERVGEIGSSDKSSTTATAVRDADSSQNGRANVMVEDFDEDAYAEEEEEETEDEGFDSLNVAERPTKAAAPAKQEADVKKEQASPSPAQSEVELEPKMLSALQQNLETVKTGMEEYFASTQNVARLMTVENRKEFARTIREERRADVEGMLRGDRESMIAGLSEEGKKSASKLLDQYADSINESIVRECDVLDKDESEYTVFNGRIVKKGPDVPMASEQEIAEFVAASMEKAANVSAERFKDMAGDFEGIPGVPKYPPSPELYADAQSEEELRERISQEKLAMYGEAAQMRQELREEREAVLRERQASRAANGAAPEQQNGRPTSWPEWKDGGDRFGADYDIEKDFKDAESVIEKFEADIEREYGMLEEQLGLKPPSAQNYLDIARTIEKLRADVEEELRADESAGRQYLRKPISESDFAELEQMYREMVEDAEKMDKAGSQLPPGAVEALAAISGMLETLEDLIQNKRVEVVRDRDYLDALRAYMLAREGGSDSEEDFAPASGNVLPSTPEEVLKEIEDNINSLDYTLEVMNDTNRRPLSASEIVEMQIMDEGLVRWRDEILKLVSNQEQVSALSRLDSLIDNARPFYMVQQPRPLKPFTGFKDPNAAAVANAWADLIGEKKPVSPQQAVSSVWGGLFDAEEPPQSETEPARAAENGATSAENAGATSSGGEDNVMTIGNGIQLDLSSVQADRLSTSRGAANAMAGDPS